MRRFKILGFYSILMTLFLSCYFEKARFVITNESDFNIDSLRIEPDSKKQFIGLNKGQSEVFNITMHEAKTDGSYFISFRNSKTDEIVSKEFGYYTNGYQVEDVINIRILNDTILINSKFEKPY